MTDEEMETKAIEYLDAGSFARSKRLLLRLLSNNPENLGAHFQIARIFWREGKFEEALKHGRTVLRLNPRESNAHLNVGLFYESLGNTRMAALSYRRELDQNPFSGESLFNLGHLYFESHRWQKAIPFLLQYLRMGFPFRQEDTLLHLGECYYKSRDIRGYMNIYSEYVDGHPHAGWAFANLGSAMLKMKDHKQALLKLLRAKRLGATTSSLDDQIATAWNLVRKERVGRSGK